MFHKTGGCRCCKRNLSTLDTTLFKKKKKKEASQIAKENRFGG
jgi:hypothetical protein